jgi:hypothetical protein
MAILTVFLSVLPARGAGERHMSPVKEAMVSLLGVRSGISEPRTAAPRCGSPRSTLGVLERLDALVHSIHLLLEPVGLLAERRELLLGGGLGWRIWRR